MNEKELQEIEEGIPNGDLTHNMVYDLIAEVRRLNVKVSQTNNLMAYKNRDIEQFQTDLQLYKDLYTKTNTQNMVYKSALQEIDNLREIHMSMGCDEWEEAMCFNKAESIANKALEVKPNE